MKPTIQEAIRQVLQEHGKVSNFDLEEYVHQIKPDCCSGTISRERRKMSDVVGEQLFRDGVGTNTYMYSLV